MIFEISIPDEWPPGLGIAIAKMVQQSLKVGVPIIVPVCKDVTPDQLQARSKGSGWSSRTRAWPPRRRRDERGGERGVPGRSPAHRARLSARAASGTGAATYGRDEGSLGWRGGPLPVLRRGAAVTLGGVSELHRRLYREPAGSTGVCRLATCPYNTRNRKHIVGL